MSAARLASVVAAFVTFSAASTQAANFEEDFEGTFPDGKTGGNEATGEGARPGVSRPLSSEATGCSIRRPDREGGIAGIASAIGLLGAALATRQHARRA